MMGRKNRFKYVCEECNAETYFSAIERGRRAALRCAGCGSMRLNHSRGSIANERLAIANEARMELTETRDRATNKNK